MMWTSLMNSICNQCFLPLTRCGPLWWIRYVTSVFFRWHLVTYRIHQRGPHHVNGIKHWLHIEFIREVHIMSTEENTGYISNSSERSTSCQRKKTDVDLPDEFTSCQRKKTLVTYRIHQRGPRHVNGRKQMWTSLMNSHHVNGRKHWLHIDFIREVHTMSTEENTGYISNSSERSTSCQRKKTLVTYRIQQRGPIHVNGRKQVWTSLMKSICSQCFLPLTWIGPLCWIRYVTSVFFRWHDVDLSDEFDM